MLLWPKKHCPFCNQSNVKRNGHYANGRQRWFCFQCNKSYHWKLPINKIKKELSWFKKWIVEGYSIRQLQSSCVHRARKLRYIIDRALSYTPKHTQRSYAKHKHLIFDGTFLFKRKCIVALMDANSNAVLNGKYGISESLQKDLFSFFYPLKLNNLNPLSITVDGNPHVIRFLVQLWPEVIIQRCIVHIQRQGLMWCRQNPKRLDAKKLRELFLQLTKITTHEERDDFLSKFYQWEKRYGSRLLNLPERGWVLSDLIRARSMILKALPNMFHFIDNPSIPKSTNLIEGYFARLKDHYRHHRGLAQHKRKAYFDWYFILKKH